MDINEIIKTITEQVIAEINKNGGAATGENGKVNYAKYIDHTLLKPDATEAKIKKVCDEAKQYNFASVCVNPSYIEFVAKELKGSPVNPCVVVGFPLGATTPAVKAFETNEVIEKGAKEVDMVLNIGAAKSGNWSLVEEDVKAVVHASRGRALVKVILETCLLTDEEKVKAAAADLAAEFAEGRDPDVPAVLAARDAHVADVGEGAVALDDLHGQGNAGVVHGQAAAVAGHEPLQAVVEGAAARCAVQPPAAQQAPWGQGGVMAHLGSVQDAQAVEPLLGQGAGGLGGPPRAGGGQVQGGPDAGRVCGRGFRRGFEGVVGQVGGQGGVLEDVRGQEEACACVQVVVGQGGAGQEELGRAALEPFQRGAHFRPQVPQARGQEHGFEDQGADRFVGGIEEVAQFRRGHGGQLRPDVGAHELVAGQPADMVQALLNGQGFGWFGGEVGHPQETVLMGEPVAHGRGHVEAPCVVCRAIGTYLA